MNRTILVFVLVLFGALTIPAIAQSGFSGFVTAITSSYASWQIFADLVIALTLVVDVAGCKVTRSQSLAVGSSNRAGWFIFSVDLSADPQGTEQDNLALLRQRPQGTARIRILQTGETYAGSTE